MDALPGLAAQFARVRREARESRQTSDPSSALAAGQTAEFWRVAGAILGDAGDALVAAADLTPFHSPAAATSPVLPCDRTVRSRDTLAWELGLAGYSAREIADVLRGHLSRTDLDEARRRLMAGQPRAKVVALLEARWREPQPPAPVARAMARQPMPLASVPAFDAELTALAVEHRVAPDLVRAVIAAESAGNPRAQSPAGAIGLMQLMPATAAWLGVDPWQPLQNLRGGIVYLAGLLRAYGEDARLALIAYNAGPQHANRVRDGSAVAYRETRLYLDAINARYPLP